MAPSTMSPNERLMRKRLNARLRQRRCRQRKREAAAKKKMDEDHHRKVTGEDIDDLPQEHHAGHHLAEDGSKSDEIEKHKMNQGTAFTQWQPAGRSPYAMGPPPGRRAHPSGYAATGSYSSHPSHPYAASAQHHMMPVYVPYPYQHHPQQYHHPHQYGSGVPPPPPPPPPPPGNYNTYATKQQNHYMDPQQAAHPHHHPQHPSQPYPYPNQASGYSPYAATTEAVPRTVSRSPSDASMNSSKVALSCTTNKGSFTPIVKSEEERELSTTLEEPIKEEEEEEEKPPSSPLMSTEKQAVVAMLSLGSDDSSEDDGDASTIQSV